MESSGGYYAENLHLFRGSISMMSDCLGRCLEDLMSRDEIRKLKEEAWEAFVELLPEIPYIGGEENPLTRNLLGSAYEMGYYALMEKRGFSLGVASTVGRKALGEFTRLLIARFGLGAMRNSVMNTGEILPRGSRRKEDFQGNWVMERVEPSPGDGFDAGVDCTSCPVADLFTKFGREGYLPYICADDYAVFREMGIALQRTQTIGNGAPRCDFRLRLEDPSRIPGVGDVEDLPEYRNGRR